MVPPDQLLRFLYQSDDRGDVQMPTSVSPTILPPIYNPRMEAPPMMEHCFAQQPHDPSPSPSVPPMYPSLATLLPLVNNAASSSRRTAAADADGNPPPKRTHEINPLIRKGRWTQAEDTRLLESVARHGPNKWRLNAIDVQTRTSDQCWKRWNDSLDPSLNHGPWIPEEDEILEHSVVQQGRMWSKIATENLNGRSGLMCKNRWDHLQRKKRRLAINAEKQRKLDEACADAEMLNCPGTPEVPSQGFHVGAVRSTGDRRERASGRYHPYLLNGGNVAVRLHQPVFGGACHEAVILPAADSTRPPIMRAAMRNDFAVSDTDRFDNERARQPQNSSSLSSPFQPSSFTWSSMQAGPASNNNGSSGGGGQRPQQQTLGAQLLLAEPQMVSGNVNVAVSNSMYDSNFFTPSFTSLQYMPPVHTYNEARVAPLQQY